MPTPILERVVAFLGASRDVATLSESDVLRYTMARRQGDPSLKGVTPGKPVRDRAIELDLVLLMTALNWAARERTSTGRRLLRENPLTGVRLPKEKNPERPVMSHDVYLKLLEVSPRVHPLLPLALIVAEGTGRRISAWRNLVWDDVDFEAGTIHWRAEHDKKGFEQVVVMSDSVRDAFAAQQKAQAAIGKTAVFQSPKDPIKTVQSASVRRLAAASVQVGEDRPAASRDVALDTSQMGHRTQGLSREGRRRGGRLED